MWERGSGRVRERKREGEKEGVGAGARKIIRTLDTRLINMDKRVINNEPWKESNINKESTKNNKTI